MNQQPHDPEFARPHQKVEQHNEGTMQGGMQSIFGSGNTQSQDNRSWITNIYNYFAGELRTNAIQLNRSRNEQRLLSQVKTEVFSRLEQSLHNQFPINIKKESQPKQVKRLWDAEVKIGLKPSEVLMDNTGIIEIFDRPDIAGKLLILGKPGAGKTTTMLELAHFLIERAEKKLDSLIPVIFSLTSWKNNKQSIYDWLIVELKSKYIISTALGKQWLDKGLLLPMLDGLDELPSQRQKPCVEAINQLMSGANSPKGLVVCSRIEEYENLSRRLQLNGAICLKPLNNDQIYSYLAAVEGLDPLQTLNSDPTFLELVRTPFWLGITTLACLEISLDEWLKHDSSESRIRYLLDTYVYRMLNKDVESNHYNNNKRPTTRQTQSWIVWLAQQMQREADCASDNCGINRNIMPTPTAIG